MKIPYQRFRFDLKVNDPLLLPDYSGSVFRGAFGAVFRRMVCALKQNECGRCMLSGTCSYAYIFETAPHAKTGFLHTGGYTKVPHPFIIEPPTSGRRVIQPGNHVEFYLVLVGRALEYLPYFICTFDEIGKAGLGKGRSGYALHSVDAGGVSVYSAETGNVTPCNSLEIEVPETFDGDSKSEQTITLSFETLVRIQSARKLATELPFGLLVRNLLRRIGMLSYFHCGGHIPAWDAQAVIARAETVEVRYNGLQWRDWERFSARQKTSMKLGGLAGNIEYCGSLHSFMPLLRAGEVLHVGKGTSFGLGKYSLQNA